MGNLRHHWNVAATWPDVIQNKSRVPGLGEAVLVMNWLEELKRLCPTGK
jgi:hypothetical protein